MRYLGVKKVKEKGKNIGFAQERQPLVKSDEVLVGILNNGVWAVAPNLTDRRDYNHFYQSYAQGMWLRMELFKIPEDKIDMFPDEGRVPVTNLTDTF